MNANLSKNRTVKNGAWEKDKGKEGWKSHYTENKSKKASILSQNVVFRYPK